METIELLPSQEQLEQSLEKHLKLLYNLRCELRTARLEHPCTLKGLLQNWQLVHKQHHLLQSQLKTLLYEAQLGIKSR